LFASTFEGEHVVATCSCARGRRSSNGPTPGLYRAPRNQAGYDAIDRHVLAHWRAMLSPAPLCREPLLEAAE
jgi:hypothetical protein